MKNRKNKIIIFIIVIGVIVAGVSFFILRHQKDGEEIYAQKVSELIQTTYNSNKFSGVVESQGAQNFTLDSEKKLLEVYVTQGQKIEEGEALYKYDDSQTKNTIASTQLEAEGIRQSVTLLKREIKELEEQLKQAADEEKYKMRSEISDKQMEIKQQEYDIQAKENEISNLKKDLEQSVVKAGMSGIVKSVNQNQSGESEKQQPFISIIQNENYVVKGLLDEISIDSLKENDPVIVRSRVDKDQFWKGTVTLVDLTQEKEKDQENSEENKEKASKYPFYVALEESGSLILGQHVYVEPDLGQEEKKEGIWLNRSFVIHDKDGIDYVWCVEKQKAVKKKVKTGQTDETTDTIEVCSGLTKEDSICWPEESIKEGQKIQIGKK